MNDVKFSNKLETQETSTEQILESGLKDQPHVEECNQTNLTFPNLQINKNNEQIRLLQLELAKARSQAGEAFNENEQWQKWAGYMEARIKEYQEANQAWEDEAFYQSALNNLNISSNDIGKQNHYSYRSTLFLWIKAFMAAMMYTVLASIPIGGLVGLLLGVIFYLWLGQGTKPMVIYQVFSATGVIGCGIFVLARLIERGIFPSFIENRRKYIAIEEYKRATEKYIYDKETKKNDQEYIKWQTQRKMESGKKEYWQQLTGEAFETELKDMLRHIGYKKFMSFGHANRPDGGVDFYVEDPSGKKCVIQCKHHKKPVSVTHLRDLLGALTATEGKATYAVMASLGGLTKPARKFADSYGIHVWTMEEVVKMSVRASSLKGK